MTTITAVLGVAVLVEALGLIWVIRDMARLRGRLSIATDEAAVMVAQMGELLDEARLLSTVLTDQMDEQTQLCASFAARAEALDAAGRQLSAAAAPPAAQPVARKSRSKAPVRKTTDVEVATPTRATTRRVASNTPVADKSDVEVARAKGMDPLGVALQRSLAADRSRSA